MLIVTRPSTGAMREYGEVPDQPAASRPPSAGRRGLLLVWLAALAVVVVAVVATVALTARSGGSRAAAPPPPVPPSVASSPAVTAGSASASAGAGSASASAAVPRPADDRPGPVILVPGYGGSESMLAALSERLRRAGRTTLILAIPDDATGDLRGQEQVLAAQVTRELAGGAPSVDLVGYSAGGIVVGLFTADHPKDVRRVVTIGSPLHGTRLAGLAAGLLPSACPTACRQMVPGSPLLAALAASQPTLAAVPWLSMWTTHDEVVQPPDSAQLAGADNVALQSVCADDAVMHPTLPADPLVAGLTLEALGTAPMPSPAASDCAAMRASGSG